MAQFKVVTFSGSAKYSYKGQFLTITDAIAHYQRHGNRIILVQEMGVRFKTHHPQPTDFKSRAAGERDAD